MGSEFQQIIICFSDCRQTIRQTWANGSEFTYERHFHRMHQHAAPGSYGSADRGVMQRVSRQLLAEGDGSTLSGASGNDGASFDRLSSSQVLFLVGKPRSNGTQQSLVDESSTHGDLIQEDFLDTYNNLTLKSLMLLKWISRFNGDTDRVKYVMKCDDDTFLNVPNLVHVLLGGTVPIYKDTFKLYTAATVQRSSWTGSSSLMGFLFRNARPIRDVTSKWYAPKYMYRRKIYPNYLSGTGYVMEATHTAKQLYRAAFHAPLFHLEDVYVTGLCASRSADTQPHHNPLFSFLRYAKRRCALRGMITQHPLTADDIRRAYEVLVVNSSACEQPAEESVLELKNAKSGARSAGNCPTTSWPHLCMAIVWLLGCWPARDLFYTRERF